MNDAHPKRWQNLIRHACPLCGGALEPMPFRAGLLRCMRDDECGFVISKSGMIRILSDENHILRFHLTPEDALLLERKVNEMSDGMGEIAAHTN